jgi:RNA polymerase sigma factor (sigma-70 family)
MDAPSDQDPPDDFLIRMCGGDDQHKWAFEVLYRRYVGKASSVARKQLPARWRRDDGAIGRICNMALYKLSRAIRDECYDPKLPVWPYLSRIVCNEVVNFLREEGRHAATVPFSQLTGFDPPDTGLVGQEARDRVEELLARLSPEKREVVRLHGLQGWTLEKTARHLNLSITKVWRLWHEAQDDLRGDEGLPPLDEPET